MEIIVIADPTISEIREMLECVAEAQAARGASLRDILPDCPDYAEYLKAGWCYLWYDSESLKPLGYTLFVFEKRKERFPLFLMGATRFCQARHILKVRKAMLAVMRNAFKNQVRAYIDTERIAKFAMANGYEKLKKGDFFYGKMVDTRYARCKNCGRNIV